MRRLFSNGLSVCMVRAALGAATCLASAQLAGAAEFFVSTAGNNAWPGTAEMPWRTLQFAADQVNDGDRVVVRPGDYAGFHLDASGTAAAPIEFFAEPGARVTQRNATTPDGINLEGASHVVIDGFAVTGMPRAGVRTVLGEFVTIRNVHAYDNDRWGIFTGFVDDLLIENNETSGSLIEHGIYVSNSGDRPRVIGNHVWGNHGSGIQLNADASEGGDGIITGALIARNRIYDNAKPVPGNSQAGGSAINLDGVQDSRIENNLLYANRASGISLFRQDGGGGSSGNLVINNTIHQPANSRWALNVRDGSTGNAVRNNILLNDDDYRGSIGATEDSLPGMTSDYNALAPRFTTDTGDSILNFAQWQEAIGGETQSFAVASAASLFVDAINVDLAARDYRLKPCAAAIDAGVLAQAPAGDLFGVPRPQGDGVDLGAIEFTAATPLAGADFDSSGAVDAADLDLWSAGFGMATGALRADGDANGDEAVNGQDFLAWQRELGPGGVRLVPEPPSASLLASLVVAAAAGFQPFNVERRRRAAGREARSARRG